MIITPLIPNARRYGWVVAFLAAAVLLAMFGRTKSALANGPSGHASCMGQEAAAISPPGSSDEVADGMPEFMRFIRGLPGSPGETIRIIAGLHEVSHEACDAALEG